MSIFMYVPGITGETSDKNHAGCIDVLRIKFSASRAITSNTSTKGDRESSNTEFSSVKLLKLMDKSTPNIFMETAYGTGKTIKLYMTKTGTGNSAHVFMEYTLEHAIFSRLNTIATKDSGRRPFEEIEISFTKLTTRYIQYDENGDGLTPVAVGFDITTNTKI
ncbi:MAG: type VI secretion system tube protein Hcp [Cellvibrionaceae bacterium]|nr:type VI secretion system tube protein Hcp [Cellvibrionaceae bacterium]